MLRGGDMAGSVLYLATQSFQYHEREYRVI